MKGKTMRVIQAASLTSGDYVEGSLYGFVDTIEFLDESTTKYPSVLVTFFEGHSVIFEDDFLVRTSTPSD